MAPSGGENAFMIEEGVATKYQQSYSKRYLGGRVKIGNGKYKEALKLYNELANRHSRAIEKLRRVEPCFYNWTHETFLAAGMYLEERFEHLLLTRFKDFGEQIYGHY